MSVPSDVEKEIARLQASAGRARHMATQLTACEDRQRLETYAQELERRAAVLEEQHRQAKPDTRE